MGRLKDRMFGVEEPLFINELVLIVSNLLYTRLFYNIKNGEVYYDLIKKYKIVFMRKLSLNTYL